LNVDELQVWAAYSPVKNNVVDAAAKAAAGAPSHSAAAAELDIYKTNCMVGKRSVHVSMLDVETN
jgi:hypothetical protein